MILDDLVLEKSSLHSDLENEEDKLTEEEQK